MDAAVTRQAFSACSFDQLGGGALSDVLLTVVDSLASGQLPFLRVDQHNKTIVHMLHPKHHCGHHRLFPASLRPSHRRAAASWR